jgi:hypothetical protein
MAKSIVAVLLNDDASSILYELDFDEQRLLYYSKTIEATDDAKNCTRYV